MTFFSTEEKFTTSSPETIDGSFDLSIRWHDDLSLNNLEVLFDALPGKPVLSPFQEPCFLHAFSQTVAKARCDRFSIASFHLAGDDRPLLLVPLVWYRKGPFRLVSLPDTGLSDQNGPVLSSEFENLPDALKANVLPMLVGSLPRCDLLKIANIAPTIGSIANPFYDAEQAVASNVALCLDRGMLDEVGSEPKKSVYKEADAKFRKLLRAGVEFVEAETAAQSEQICRVLLEQRRQRQNWTGDEVHDEFYRYLSGMTGSEGLVKAFALKNGEEVVAAAIVLANRACANGVLVSIGDPKWHRLSPGMVLFVKSIEWARQRDVARFSLGAGMYAYKNRFKAAPVVTKSVMVPKSKAGDLLVAAISARQSARQLRRNVANAGKSLRPSHAFNQLVALADRSTTRPARR
ncbi:GNAT family N-acetyltransferase [Roseibium sp. MMSF_3544]|uniref:GNAT family N-acetyltransferase n=1 Tax=unclassified Roseibium TaxID=2629323 RepID=UPI00273F689B|nr:GNAT family N-acetyltransferase [Roseibium sp. MMSF_3544]